YAEKEVRDRETAGQQDHGAPHWATPMVMGPNDARTHRLSSARTVVPAVVISPSFALIVASVGTNTSTREPNRMMPNRSPWWASSPTLLYVTMRRAMRPAI